MYTVLNCIPKNAFKQKNTEITKNANFFISNKCLDNTQYVEII